MTVSNCTCRVTRRERFLNPDCPIHGDAEMRRRHEAARQALTDAGLDDFRREKVDQLQQIFATPDMAGLHEWLKSLTVDERITCAVALEFVQPEGCSHE